VLRRASAIIALSLKTKKHLNYAPSPMIASKSRPLTIFTPSFAGVSNTNAQNLTVKEIIARLPEDRFYVTMLSEGDDPDPRLIARPNTRLLAWTKHGNTLRLLKHCLFPPPDIYFFPRTGPLDRLFFDARKRLGLKTALITYIVMAMDPFTGGGMIGRSVTEGDVVFANSVHVAETVRRMFGVHATPIYDGVDRRYFFPPEDRAENATPIVLYAGSFQPRKRVELVIQNAARFPRLKFHLAGKGETEHSCRELARQLGCNNVSFPGHLTPQKLGQEMRKADIFFFPSILEGNPQVLLQAGACGLPCIAMDLYHSDYVVNGSTGFLVKSDTELSEKLEQVSSNVGLRRSLGSAAARHASHFDWDKIAEQWAAIFEEAVEQRQPFHDHKKSS
jgi:glycosyltransferase involved in cell wall biosynthesis